MKKFKDRWSLLAWLWVVGGVASAEGGPWKPTEITLEESHVFYVTEYSESARTTISGLLPIGAETPVEVVLVSCLGAVLNGEKKLCKSYFLPENAIRAEKICDQKERFGSLDLRLLKRVDFRTTNQRAVTIIQYSLLPAGKPEQLAFVRRDGWKIVDVSDNVVWGNWEFLESRRTVKRDD